MKGVFYRLKNLYHIIVCGREKICMLVCYSCRKENSESKYMSTRTRWQIPAYLYANLDVQVRQGASCLLFFSFDLEITRGFIS